MRKFDAAGLRACEKQAVLFSSSLKESSLSSPLFVKTYMCSDFASSIDRDSDVDFVSYFVARPSSGTVKKALRFSSDELYWMGYIYRYWAYTREATSRQIYHAINATELRKYFLSYHTQDPEKAIEMLNESNPLFSKNDLGVVRRFFQRKK